MSVNRVIITGNLGRDAELRQTAGNGTDVLNFTVAVNDRRYVKATDEYEDYTNWVRCALFGKRATALAPFMKQGTKVAVEGKLRYSSWTDKETGKQRSSLEVNVDEIDLMTRRGDGGSAEKPAPAGNQADAYNDDEDLPF